MRVRKLYVPIARELLQAAGKSGEICLIVDAIKVGSGHQLLIVAVAYRKRALPVVWTWVKGRIGHSTSVKQLALLACVHRLIPNGLPVLVVGGREFGVVDVMRQLDRWQRFRDVLDKPGQSKWLGEGFLTREYVYRVHLLAHWQQGKDTPWLLATHLTNRQATLRAYRRRPWIEEVFGDMEKHGFDLESTHLCHFLRLSRLTLAVTVLYVWKEPSQVFPYIHVMQVFPHTRIGKLYYRRRRAQM